MQLDPAALAAGVRLVSLDVVGSTNVEALSRARAGERGPLWVTARRQTGGKGRRGRAWASQPGNLYATLLLTDPSPANAVAQLSFVSALAVHDAIVDVAPMLAHDPEKWPPVFGKDHAPNNRSPRLTLKWPNDVLCGGRKFCGILLEGEGATVSIVALGIGINCTHHPRDTAYPATNLAEAGLHVTPEAVLAALSHAMLQRLTQWDRGAGFALTRVDWLKRAEGLGGPLQARLHDRELTGMFETIDEAGHLVLRRPDGRRETVAAGDVFPLHRAEPA
jgi:BirA family transcriptional regulator, biotin operon repressor / biotin---[acetyl-CoA-carboxylase] ligase